MLLRVVCFNCDVHRALILSCNGLTCFVAVCQRSKTLLCLWGFKCQNCQECICMWGPDGDWTHDLMPGVLPLSYIPRPLRKLNFIKTDEVKNDRSIVRFDDLKSYHIEIMLDRFSTWTLVGSNFSVWQRDIYTFIPATDIEKHSFQEVLWIFNILSHGCLQNWKWMWLNNSIPEDALSILICLKQSQEILTQRQRKVIVDRELKKFIFYLLNGASSLHQSKIITGLTKCLFL